MLSIPAPSPPALKFFFTLLQGSQVSAGEGFAGDLPFSTEYSIVSGWEESLYLFLSGTGGSFSDGD